MMEADACADVENGPPEAQEAMLQTRAGEIEETVEIREAADFVPLEALNCGGCDCGG